MTNRLRGYTRQKRLGNTGLRYIHKIRSAKPLGALTDTNCSGSDVAEQGILMYGSNGGGEKTTRTLVPVL